MYSSSRGILYSALPTADDEDVSEENRTRTTPKRDDARADPAAEEPTVDDTTPTASRANWTGSVPADD